MADHVPVGALTEEQHPLGHQRVEPAAGLVDPFRDEVGGEPSREHVRGRRIRPHVPPLGERHGAGVEPCVDHLRDAAGLLPSSPGRRGDLVDGRPVGIDAGHVAAGQLGQLGQGPHHRVVVLAGHRQMGSGVPQNRSRESDQSTLLRSQSPYRPCLMCSGYQLTALVGVQQLVLPFGGADVPGRPGVIEERSLASPAERVGVLVGARRGPGALASRGPRSMSGSASLTNVPGRTAGPAGEPAFLVHRVEHGPALLPADLEVLRRRRRGPCARARFPPRGRRSPARTPPGAHVGIVDVRKRRSVPRADQLRCP